MQRSLESGIQEIASGLIADIRRTVSEKLLVAFSGGEDSTLVAYLAKQALGEKSNPGYRRLGKFTYEKARKGVAEVSKLLGLSHYFIDGVEKQSQIWRYGPSCNMCTRYAKLQSILDFGEEAVVATGANRSDSWGINGVKINGKFYSPLIDLDKGTIRNMLSFFGLQPVKIGESSHREGCKLKHLLKMMINPDYHGNAVALSNEILLDFLKEIDHKASLANVKIIGPLSKNIALVNVFPHLDVLASKEVVKRINNLSCVDEAYVLNNPIKLKVLANPGLFNDFTARDHVLQGFLQRDFSVAVSVEWIKSSNPRLRTFQVIGFDHEDNN